MDRTDRITDVKIGLFVIAAIALLIVGSVLIVGSRALSANQVSYTVLLKDSAGVQAGDRVRQAGVPIGRIRTVELRIEEDWPVRIVIDVDATVPIRTDAKAELATQGLLGAAFLQILAGSPNSDVAQPGATIYDSGRGGMAGAMSQVEELAAKAMELFDQLAIVLENLDADIGPNLEQLQKVLSDENVEEISAILSSARTTMDEVVPRVGPLLDRLDSIAADAEEGLADLPQVTAGAAQLMEDLSTALGPDGKRLADLLDTAQTSLVSADDALSLLQNNGGDITAIVQDLRDASASLRRFADQVAERPSSILRRNNQPSRTPGQDVE